MRHCQSAFNAHYERTGRDPGIEDPPLTDKGEQQAERAAALLCAPGAGPIRRLLVSPYRRTLQTVAPIARRLGLRPEIVPLARERFAFSCDVGSPPGRLMQDWPALDFSGLADGWWQVDENGGGAMESERSVSRRAAAFARWMHAQEHHAATLLVSHWGFLLALTGRSFDNGETLLFDPSRALAAGD